MADESLTAIQSDDQADPPAHSEVPRPLSLQPPNWGEDRSAQAISWRIRIIYGIAVLFSVAWFAVCFTYVDKTVGWSNLFELQPAEFGGVVGAALLPLAIQWLIVAFLDRGAILRLEAAHLRRHLDLLIYPADDSEARLATITSSLRRQAADLSAASDEAMVKAEQVGTLLARHTETLEKLAERFGSNSQRVVDSLKNEIETLTRSTDGTVERVAEVRSATAALVQATEDASSRTRDFSATMNEQLESLDGTAQKVTARADEVGLHLQQSVDGLGRSVSAANARIDEMVRTVGIQGELIMATSGKAADRAEEVTGELNRRVEALDALFTRQNSPAPLCGWPSKPAASRGLLNSRPMGSIRSPTASCRASRLSKRAWACRPANSPALRIRRWRASANCPN
jgi:hypothetical protein